MKVHKYVLRRLLRDEYARWVGQFSKNPIAGLKRVLNVQKIKYESISKDEITIVVGERKLRIKQED